MSISKIFLAIVFIVVVAAPAPSWAQSSMVGSWVDDDCLLAYTFRSNGRFTELDIDTESHGSWSFDNATLHVKFDSGQSFSTAVVSNMFAVEFSPKNDKPYSCFLTRE